MKQTDLELTGKMSVWFPTIATCEDETLVALRLVNLKNNYDKNHPGVEHGVLFWHCPTSVFQFNPEEPPNLLAAAAKAQTLLTRDWPALATAQMRSMDQDLTGKLGGYPDVEGARKIDAVTRVVLDLGECKELPDVVWRPGEEISFPFRDPVLWVNVKDITVLPQTVKTKQGKQVSSYVVNGPHTVSWTEKALVNEAIVSSIILQDSVARPLDNLDMLVKPSVPVSFRPFTPRLVSLDHP